MENFCKENLKLSSKKWVIASVYPKFRRNLCLRSTNADLYHYAGNNPVRYIDPDGRVTEQQNAERNKYQNGYAPPNKIQMERLVNVGLFNNQGNTGTHNLTVAQNTKDGRASVGAGRFGKNIDYRGKTGTIFEGMQFIYNSETGLIVVDEVNKGTFDYRSPYGHIPYLSHKNYDIDPWVEWGTGGADNINDVLMPRTLWDEIDLVLKEFESDKISGRTARKKIQELLPRPPVPPKNMEGGVEK
ncbi:MAG TPA: hypothetical protein DCZ76_03705 [Treponema sp.]|nr:hypothetical protein [Treponema sp.]